jgi:hypothetical protein
MKLHYLIAPAYNAIRLPLMAFTDRDKAIQFMADLGMPPGTSAYNDRVSFRFVIDAETGAPVELEGYVRDNLAFSWEEATTPRQRHVDRILRALFKSGHYDSGNGELYRFDLETHEEGTPVTVWDFD